MNVEASKRTLQSVLGQPDEQLRIPKFQRPYAWGATEIQDLWDDVTEDFDRKHFLGSIVLSDGEDASRPQVIDGQQRLTTLVLLLSVLRDSCLTYGLQKQVERITNLLIVDQWTEGDAQWRLRTGDKNWQVFRDYALLRADDPQRKSLDDAKTLDPKVRGNNRALLDNLAQLRGLVDARLQGLPDDGARADWLRRADNHLVKDLELVVIRVDELDDAFLLFETLNDRGLQLSASDLLKNRLLGSIAAQEGEEDVDFAAKEWDEMLEDLGAHVDVTRFLRHYLLGATPRVKKDEVFAEFKKRMAIVGARAIFDDLKIAARAYGEFEDPSRVKHGPTREVLADLQTIRAVFCYVALIPARRYLSEQDFVQFARLSEVLTYRYSSILGWGTKELESKYHQCAKLLIESKGARLTEARRILIAELPSSDDFISAFMRASMGTQYLLKYTLRKLESSLGGEKQIKPTSDVHIEHVMPQKLSTPWIQELGDDVSRHGEFLNRWGNLTLFLDKLNIPASNKSFDHKKPYYEKSDVELTRQLTALETWGIAEIEARQRALAEMADSVWSVPLEDEPSPPVPASTLSAFETAAGEYWPRVVPHLVETSAEEIASLAERLPSHIATLAQHGDLADRLAKDLTDLLERWDEYDAEQRSVVQAAIAYFLSEDDAVPDSQPGGLVDDEAVIEAAFSALGRSRDPAGRR